MYGSGLPGPDGKESASNAGDPGSIPGWGRSPGEREWQPTAVLLPRKSHGQRNLVGYSPWGHKESTTTERLTLAHLKRGHFWSYLYIYLCVCVYIYIYI